MKFPKGKYYIGDPSLAINAKEFDIFLDNTIYKNQNYSIHHYKNTLVACGFTKYGDGMYPDVNEHYNFTVNYGILSVLPIELVDKKTLLQHYDEHSVHEQFCTIKTYENDFFVYINDGMFRFGDVIINTGDEIKVNF